MDFFLQFKNKRVIVGAKSKVYVQKLQNGSKKI